MCILSYVCIFSDAALQKLPSHLLALPLSKAMPKPPRSPASPASGLTAVQGEGSSQAPTMWGTRTRKKSASRKTSFLLMEQLQLITRCYCWLVLPASVTGFSFTLHTKIVIHRLFPRALQCPLNILHGWHNLAQNKHAPWAHGLHFFQGFLAAITY